MYIALWSFARCAPGSSTLRLVGQAGGARCFKYDGTVSALCMAACPARALYPLPHPLGQVSVNLAADNHHRLPSASRRVHSGGQRGPLLLPGYRAHPDLLRCLHRPPPRLVPACRQQPAARAEAEAVCCGDCVRLAGWPQVGSMSLFSRSTMLGRKGWAASMI